MRPQNLYRGSLAGEPATSDVDQRAFVGARLDADFTPACAWSHRALMHETRSLDSDLTDLERAIMGWWLLLLAIALGAYLVAALLRPDWF